MTFLGRSTFRPLLAALAFVTYVAAILWHHGAYKSTWAIEQSGSLPIATSYLYYDQPFSAIDGGLWAAFYKRAASKTPTAEEPIDSFLSSVAEKKVASDGIVPTTLDGNGLGYAYFATAALFLFGPHTSSLVFGLCIVLGISVLAFLLRFPDDRMLTIPILFLALTLMLLTPHATNQWLIDQSPIGGHRFFVIAAILPALHIILELFDSSKGLAKQSIYSLLVLQFVLLLCVISIRMSATYFVAAIVFAAMLSIWIRRHEAAERRLVATKLAALLMLAMVAYFGARLLPSAYREAGTGSEVFWHRGFSTLGIHPSWPFENLATKFDCRSAIPEGLQRGLIDRNGHCAYVAGVDKGAEAGPVYGAQYEKILRQAYWDVVREYPLRVLETYLRYKPLMIWQTLSTSTELDISGRNVPVLIALGLQLAIVITLIRLPPGEISRLHRICATFLIIAPFSLLPPLWAYSEINSSTDLICYMYVGLVLVVTGALRYLPAWRYART